MAYDCLQLRRLCFDTLDMRSRLLFSPPAYYFVLTSLPFAQRSRLLIPLAACELPFVLRDFDLASWSITFQALMDPKRFTCKKKSDAPQHRPGSLPASREPTLCEGHYLPSRLHSTLRATNQIHW